jgi:hypothetical protein
MFELFEDPFAEIVHKHLSVLDRRYVGDYAPEILQEMQDMFDEMFDTRFFLVRNGTGQPAYPYLFENRRAAEEFTESLRGKSDVSVGITLIDK